MQGFYYLVLLVILVLIMTSIEKSKNFLKQFASEFLAVIGSIGLALTNFMSNSDVKFIGEYSWKDSSTLIFICSGLFLIISVIMSSRRNVSNKTLREEVLKVGRLEKDIATYKSEYYKLCSSSIRNIFSKFYTTGNERISIYKYTSDHFVLLGRYSPSPEFNKRTEYQYSENEGFIGLGWTNGESFMQDAPKYTSNKKGYKTYIRERCDINDSRLSKLKMKSRSMYVKTIDDKNTPGNPDGIVVFESLDPKKVNKDECLILITEHERSILTLLKNMKGLTNKIKA